MPQVTIEKTQKYLIVKIPLKSFKSGRAEISSRAQNNIDRAIIAGLEDIESSRTFGPFKTVKEFKKSLKSSTLGK